MSEERLYELKDKKYTIYASPKGYGKTYYELEKLRKENQQLKEQLENASKNYTKYIQERDNVLYEIRECIDKFPCIHYASAEKVDGKRLSGKLIPTDDLLQILDKVKE